QACLHPLGMVGVRRKGDLLDGLGALWRAFDVELPRLPLQILLTRFEEMRGDFPGLVPNLAGDDGCCRPGGRRAAAGVRAETIRRRVGVTLLHLDVSHRDPRLLSKDLGVGRLVPLPVGWMRISQLSNILIPRISKCLDGPAPTISVKLEIPMPISSPRCRLAACSRRSSAYPILCMARSRAPP